ncbi:MAG TPA: TRAP transporter large permease [Candidatus Baltobacteraceae bacterium]|nr:TRAP transporter large permease [Candidatus Baltobacteraceae bacterium]
MTVLVGSFFLAVALGIPISASIGISAVLYILLYAPVSLAIIAQQMTIGIDSFPLLAIPLFLLAGLLMSESNITARIIRFADALVGRIVGGLAMVMVISCMIFGAISGSGVADVTAIGSLMLPAMERQGYRKGLSASLLGCAGSLGTVIPPSIVMIILGVTTGTSIGKLYLGGFIPGVFTGVCLMALSWMYARRMGLPAGDAFTVRKLLVSFKEAFLSLMTPVIIIGGIITGVFTATEAAAVASAYALILGLFVYRSLMLSQLPGIFLRVAETTGIILFIISAAALFGWILAAEQIPQRMAEFFLSISHNYYVLLILINVLLLILGTFMETIAIIIIVVPVLMPLVTGLGMDPVHFGVMVTVNMAIGANTPPVGVDLIAACRVGHTTLDDAMPYIWPFVTAMTVALTIITFIPALVTFIPHTFMR